MFVLLVEILGVVSVFGEERSLLKMIVVVIEMKLMARKKR